MSFLRSIFWCLFLVGIFHSAAAESNRGLTEIPFANRSGPRGVTLFTAMPAAQTGVQTENNYDDPKMWSEHYQELIFGEMGSGVAIGDYDNDGRPDIFVVNKTGAGRLFRNLGQWKFEDVTEKAGLNATTSLWSQGFSALAHPFSHDSAGSDEPGFWKQGCTFVDVNNDGYLDIHVCRFGAPNLLYINQRDGTFKEEAAARGLAVNDASGMAAFCDYDRDGWLDVYIHTNMLDATAHPNGQRGYLFHNNRDGTFTNVTEQAGIKGESASHSATWWDYDNDGWPDLYVANDYSTPDVLYHNNHDGTFTDTINSVVPHLPYYSMGADLGDINNDGRIDLFVADMAASSHEKDQRGMASSRARAQVDPQDSSIAPQYMHNALFINTGTSTVLEGAFLTGLASTDWSWSPRFEDLDNDGRLDLFVTNGMLREYHNSDLLAKAMELEATSAQRDLVRKSPVFSETHRAYRNLEDYRFEDVSAAWGLNDKGVSFGAAFGDLDGDGDLDLVYANYQQGVTILRNDSDSGHSIIVALRGTRSNRFGVGSTVQIESATGKQVRQLVLARGYLSSSEPILHFGLGKDIQIDRLTVTWPSGEVQVFEHLSVDRKFTISEPETASKIFPKDEAVAKRVQFIEVSKAINLSVQSREGATTDFGAQSFLPMRFGRRGPSLASGDLNGDGRDDIILGGTPKDPARIFIANTGGQFSEINLPPAGSNALADGPCLIFDADGDGANDILITKGGANVAAGSPLYQPRLLLNDGRGKFRAAAVDALPPLAISVGAVAAADFNHDGSLDLFLGGRVQPGRYPLSPRSALWANHRGKFEDVTDSLAPALREVGMVTSASWTDVDGDGWLDLIVTIEWGTVKYFHNDQGRSFSDWSEKAGFSSAGSGWWTSVTAADFNEDGKPDYIVGNVGLNTQYRASAKEPALLFYGPFSGGAAPQIIEAYNENGRIVPWRTRGELGAKIPAILKRFPSNDAYAAATLGEILGEDKLKAAQLFTATELRSGVFLSQPDGTYRFKPLPQIAQIAPAQGIVAGDFDGDGHADIYVLQNSFAPVASIGRFDGGISQLLRGDGKGEFEAIEPSASGLIVPGDAKALAVLDLDQDGWPDFILSRNDALALAFHNQGMAPRKSVAVRLIGPRANPTAIGARVSIEFANGEKRFAEIYAGSGYASQSTATCFFGYAVDNPPRTVMVHWPAGELTTHPMTAISPTVIINAPDASK